MYLTDFMPRIIILGYLSWICFSLMAQGQLKFSVSTGDYLRQDCPITADLSGLNRSWQDTTYALFLLADHKKIQLPAQLETGAAPRLHFVLRGQFLPRTTLLLVLEPAPALNVEPQVTIKPQTGGYRFSRGKQPILHYQADLSYPPAGVDHIFARSGYIHPLWSPSGSVLTRIQPPDHYHHYGLWGPWTDTRINGRQVDFWNLSKGEGTVRFAQLQHIVEGPVWATLSVLQEHVDFGAKGADQVALNELLEMRVWNADPAGQYWLLDYTSTFTCPLDSGIFLAAYRYGGGLGFRAPEAWTRQNASVLTSEGHTRSTADGTKARWCILAGPLESGSGGLLIMDHPSNRAHPQPMRVWPEDANEGRGDVFFEFCPIRQDSWPIKKNTLYAQRYRILVFEGSLNTEAAERYWRDFAHPPQISLFK